MLSVVNLLYPFTAFIFVRVAIRCFGKWAASPRPALFTLGMAASVLTFHSGSKLYFWTTTTPFWWIQALVVVAFSWVIYKNLRTIWKFESLRVQAES